MGWKHNRAAARVAPDDAQRVPGLLRDRVWAAAADSGPGRSLVCGANCSILGAVRSQFPRPPSDGASELSAARNGK